MILVSKGKLSIAQQVDSATAEDSTNVIQLGTYSASGWYPAGLEGSILSIQNSVVATGSGALTIDVVLARESTLDNVVSIGRLYIAAVTDYRTAVAGAPLFEMEISSWIGWLAEKIGTANTSDMYLGIIYTPTSTAVYTLNAGLSSAKLPDGMIKTQKTVSPVGVPAVCSAGSGE
jgi:hypothetical protein